MRKSLFFLLAMAAGTVILPLETLLAQNSSPYWSLAGNSNASSSSKLGTTNSVPLRLLTNNSTRVYISSGGNVGIGSSSPVQKLHVSGNGYISGRLGIGTTSPAYKLHVNGNASISSGLYVGNNGVYGYNTGGPGVYAKGSSQGLWAESLDGNAVYATTTNGYGVYATSTYGYGVYSTSGTLGVYGSGVNSTGTGYGLYGYGSSSSSNSYDIAVGVYGSAYSGTGRTSYGVYGTGLRGVYGVTYTGGGNGVYAQANAASAYGLSAISSQSIAVYAYTGNTSSFAGYFLGKVYSSGGYTSSDRKLKEDIKDVSSGLDILNKLQPKTYRFRQDGNYKLMNLPQGMHYGLIAQEVEQVLPTLISEADFNTARVPQPGKEISPVNIPSGSPNVAVPSRSATEESKGEIIEFKTLNYTELIPIMVKAIQELSKENKDLKQQLDELKQSVKLSSGNSRITLPGSVKLGQNIPNPGAQSTSIEYNLPEGVGKGQLLITDNLGRTIKTLPLSGSGLVNIDTSTFSSGVYNYSLLVGSRTLETKKMTILK